MTNLKQNEPTQRLIKNSQQPLRQIAGHSYHKKSVTAAIAIIEECYFNVSSWVLVLCRNAPRIQTSRFSLDLTMTNELETRVLQGSGIGPVMFLLYTGDNHNVINKTNYITMATGSTFIHHVLEVGKFKIKECWN